MKTKNETFQPESPEDLRALAEEWRARPGDDWNYSMPSMLDAACLSAKLIKLGHNRHRVGLTAGAYCGECICRDWRLRGKWIKCGDDTCLDHAACPGWVVQVAGEERSDCVFGCVGYMNGPTRPRHKTGGSFIVDLDDLRG